MTFRVWIKAVLLCKCGNLPKQNDLDLPDDRGHSNNRPGKRAGRSVCCTPKSKRTTKEEVEEEEEESAFQLKSSIIACTQAT